MDRKILNEFRQDIVSGDWVLISTERAKKPTPSEDKHSQFYQDKATCPFEDPQRSDHRDPIIVYNKGNKVVWDKGTTGEWTTQVVKNKYPALKDGFCAPPRNIGPFLVADGFGFHLPRSYIYFAIGFSIFVEILNTLFLKKQTQNK